MILSLVIVRMCMYNDDSQLLKNIKPNAFVQNTRSWCWVVCAKIVGFDYLYKQNKVKDYDYLIKEYEVIEDVNLKYGIPLNLNNLREEYTGLLDGMHTVDAWQLAIVSNVFKGKAVRNHLATDIEKENALRYVITGNINGDINVKTVGEYYKNESLLKVENFDFQKVLGSTNSFIGNYVLDDGTAHSVVVKSVNQDNVMIYDPWDGYKKLITLQEAFEEGFRTNKGYGKIQWVQYVE